MAYPDLQIRGGGGERSSTPWEKGVGAQVSKKFFRPLGPQFGLIIRGRRPPGPFPGSPTDNVTVLLFKMLIYCFQEQICNMNYYHIVSNCFSVVSFPLSLRWHPQTWWFVVSKRSNTAIQLAFVFLQHMNWLSQLLETERLARSLDFKKLNFEIVSRKRLLFSVMATSLD